MLGLSVTHVPSRTAWQYPPCQFAVPSHNSGFSYLGLPAPAGMSDCYESMSRTTIRDRPLRQPLIRHLRHPFVIPAPHSSFRRRACPVPRTGPESRGWGEGIVARGLVPRWGQGGAWQYPPCQFAVPSHNSGFSYLGLPAPAGISDCDESVSRTTIRDRPLRQPLIRHSRHPFVNPAPHSSFRRRACPVPRCGPGIQGWGEGIVALGLVPSLGRTARSRKLHGPAYTSPSETPTPTRQAQHGEPASTSTPSRPTATST